MSPQPQNLSAPSRGFFPILLLLFIGSGCAALIYEIVWLQMLQLVMGSSGISIGLLLGTFMGGMCLGSLALPRFIPATMHPLRVYALLELGIGLFGVMLLGYLPIVGRIYVEVVGHGLPGVFLRGLIAAICLLPPTILMGATLPAIARWVEMNPKSVSWLGFFYGGNTAGAVLGCLLAGFYLLRVHDMVTATYVAVAINLAVGIVGFVLSSLAPYRVEAGRRREDVPTPSTGSSSRATAIYLAIALSGFCALGSEVVWTRLLSLLFGGSVYAFSIILAVFLVGLGIGSAVGAMISRESANPAATLGVCQLLLPAALAWSAFMICSALPYWPIDFNVASQPRYMFQLDLMRACWAILPGTILWGASFPLALAAVARPGLDGGRLVGGVYAANTVGAILGALLASLVLIPTLGTHGAQQVIVGLSCLAAILVFARVFWFSGAVSPTAGVRGGFAVVVTLLVGTAFLSILPPTSWELIAQGRKTAGLVGTREMIYMGEGMNSSVAVTKDVATTTVNFHVSGKVEASTDPNDMRLQRMLGHLSALLHPNPKSVLIVGCGAGVTAGCFTLYPEIERIVICEMEPLIPQVVATHFAAENYGVVKDSRVTVIYDDARHYVLTTQDKFDIITSDPIHPWVKGSATLYTQEYFETLKRRLNPGGVVTQWVPLYESTAEVVKSEIATFCAAFPNGIIWGNERGGLGYDTVVSGTVEGGPIDVDAIVGRMTGNEYASVNESIAAVGFASVLELLATYSGRGTDLQPWLSGAEINRDRNLRLQYLAGLGMNLHQEHEIYRAILRYCRFPEDLLGGSGAFSPPLRALIGSKR